MRKTMIALTFAAVLYQVPAQAGSYVTVDLDGTGTTALTGINANGETIGITNAGALLREPDGSVAPILPGYTYVLPNAINARGEITGFAQYSCGGSQCSTGFLQLADGTTTVFSASGAPDLTYAIALNKKGDVAGFYAGSDGDEHGFIRKRSGKISTIDAPSGQSVILNAVNDKGYTAGDFLDSTATHGLLVAPDGSRTVFDAPGARVTVATGLNDDGTIVGYYIEGNTQVGYLRTADGTITPITGMSESRTSAINRSSDAVGYAQPKNHGFAFLLQSSGDLVNLGIKGPRSEAVAISDNGTVAGSYAVKDGKNPAKHYGFIWSP
jgi:uncharacterized membrane protein